MGDEGPAEFTAMHGTCTGSKGCECQCMHDTLTMYAACLLHLFCWEVSADNQLGGFQLFWNVLHHCHPLPSLGMTPQPP